MAIQLSISKTFQGAIIVSALINGEYVDHQYMGYSIKEAKQLFKAKYLSK